MNPLGGEHLSTSRSMHPDGSALYVSDFENLLEVETVTHTVVGPIGVPDDIFSVLTLAVHPTGHTLYAGVLGDPDGLLLVMDLDTRTVATTVRSDLWYSLWLCIPMAPGCISRNCDP